MTKDQEDTLNMFQAADNVLQEHDGVWNGNGPFSDAVQGLEDNIDEIEDLRDQQEEDITGITVDKQNKREKLQEMTYLVGSIIVFYASVNNNRKLLEKVDFTHSELRNARDNELPGMSDQVHEEALDLALVLAPFGLTAAMITELGQAITDFVGDISKPRAALSETSAATEQLPGVFHKTIKLLEERLDKGMELFRLSEPDFYTQYFNARIIVNSPTLKRALEVKFIDMETELSVKRVKVKVDTNIFRRSSKLGNIRVQSLDEGAHHLEAVLPGYDKEILDFNVISGETTKLVIKMRKL